MKTKGPRSPAPRAGDRGTGLKEAEASATTLARVAVVTNVLAVAMLGDPHAPQHALAVITALDAYDADQYAHNQRGQMSWADETEPDDD